MGTTTSFAPLAERLAAKAHEIYSDLEGQTAIAKMLGLFFCVVLYALVHVCHEVDARAKEDGRLPSRSTVEDNGPFDAGTATPRLRLTSTLKGRVGWDFARAGWDELARWAAPHPTAPWRNTTGPPKNRGFSTCASARLIRCYNATYLLGVRVAPLQRRRALLEGFA